MKREADVLFIQFIVKLLFVKYTNNVVILGAPRNLFRIAQSGRAVRGFHCTFNGWSQKSLR